MPPQNEPGKIDQPRPRIPRGDARLYLREATSMYEVTFYVHHYFPTAPEPSDVEVAQQTCYALGIALECQEAIDHVAYKLWEIYNEHGYQDAQSRDCRVQRIVLKEAFLAEAIPHNQDILVIDTDNIDEDAKPFGEVLRPPKQRGPGERLQRPPER